MILPDSLCKNLINLLTIRNPNRMVFTTKNELHFTSKVLSFQCKITYMLDYYF